jgi:hypothetical protein
MKKVGNKQQQKNVRVPRVVSMGRVDLNLVLNLPDEVLNYYKIEWEMINEIQDLVFLKDNKDMWDRMQLNSNNSIINTLLFINKSHSVKTFVEYLSFSGIKYGEKEFFFKEIITYVTEHNYLFLIEEEFINSPNQITLILKSGKKTKTFEIVKQESTLPQQQNTGLGIFENFKVDLAEFDYFLIDLEEIFFYFSTYAEILINLRNLLEQKVLRFKNLKIAILYPDLIRNVNTFNLDTVNIISSILSYADISVFEKKEALSLFNILNQINNAAENTKELDEKDVQRYFMNDIKFSRSNSNKVGLFISELSKLNLVEFRGEKLTYTNEYDLNLYPKINHSNHKLVEDYKRLISVNYPQMRSVFLGGFFSVLVTVDKALSREYYSSFLTGTELSKRILEIFKNKLEMPIEQEFYVVKIPKSTIDNALEKEELSKREQKFVLDCINKQTSNLKYYNPLFDGHLNSYFASDNIRKQLKDKGFINTEGFIMYDSNYKSLMGASPQRKRINEIEKEKQLLYAIKNVNNEDSKIKSHLDSYSRVLKSNSPTNKKLPTFHFEYTSPPKSFLASKNKKKLNPINLGIFIYLL